MNNFMTIREAAKAGLAAEAYLRHLGYPVFVLDDTDRIQQIISAARGSDSG